MINNGVDIDVFRPLDNNQRIREKLKIDKKFMLTGVATTWDKRKGFDDYLRLSKVLTDEYAIVLVGLTKKQIELLPDNIIGIERTDNLRELVELYSASDIVLNLSYQETFGMTTVEGFACGTPGIVYNSTASPELITPETGKIVEPGDIKQLVDAIKEIKTKGKKYYSANCRKRAEMYYNKQDRFNEYIKLYERLLNEANVKNMNLLG